jgi:hypothetical protein
MNFETDRVYPGPDPNFDLMTSEEIRSFITETENHIAFARDHGADELFIIGLADQRSRASAELARRNGNGAAATEPLIDAYPYGVEDGRIVRYQTVKENNTISVPLCNFDAQIKEEIVLDDGAETHRLHSYWLAQDRQSMDILIRQYSWHQ